MSIISKRITPFQLEREFARYEFSTRYMASSSDAQTLTLSELLKISGKSFEDFGDISLGYTDSHGALSLRKAIAGKYQHIEAAQVLVHVGAEEAIFNFFHSVLKSGDHVIVHTPCYESFLSVPASLGIEVSEWRETWENNFQVSVESLEKLLQKNTKAVFINFPHNPTGSMISKSELEKLVALVESKNIFLFSDEVYQGLEFDSSNKLPSVCDLYPNSLSLGVLSKSHGLAGLRLGWVATQRSDVYQALAAQKDYSTICHSPLIEAIAESVFACEEEIISTNLSLLRKNQKLALAFLHKWSEHFEWIEPKGSTMMFPRAKNPEFFERFWQLSLDRYGVFIVRGNNFNFPKHYFRLGMGRRDFPTVLEQLDRAVNETLNLKC